MAWTQEDVDKHNARIGAKLPAHLAPDHPRSLLLQQIQEPPMKGHKYRAIPCIVTADLTLFTRKEIEAAEVARPLTFPLPKLKASLKARALRLGIIGEWFGSTKEAKRWIELNQLQHGGLIRELCRQVTYYLIVHPDTSIGSWVADFTYDERVPAENMARVEWREVVEDCKGLKTALYRWKKKHVEAQYGFTIRET